MWLSDFLAADYRAKLRERIRSHKYSPYEKKDMYEAHGIYVKLSKEKIKTTPSA